MGDLDKSGSLSITELIYQSPWAAEEEAVHRLRQVLLDKFSTYQRINDALDADKNGQISLQEIQVALKKHGISEEEATGGATALSRVFDLLDVDLSGELSIEELLTADPREGARDRDEGIKRMRQCLGNRFGSKAEILKAFDTTGTGKLCLFELEAGVARHKIPRSEICGNKDLKWLFKVLDVDGSGDLDLD